MYTRVKMRVYCSLRKKNPNGIQRMPWYTLQHILTIIFRIITNEEDFKEYYKINSILKKIYLEKLYVISHVFKHPLKKGYVFFRLKS